MLKNCSDTLILQLGVILNTVPAWKKAYKVRVAVFVEYESDVEEERGRVRSLLENLRIEAEILVFWLASGSLETYEVIVNGAGPGGELEDEVEKCLGGQEWWDEIQRFRGKRGEVSASEDLAEIASIFTTGSNWPEASFQQGPRGERVERFMGLRRLLRKSRRKHTMSGISRLGVNLGMRTHKLSQNVVQHHASQGSASEFSSSESESDSDGILNSAIDSDGPESAASEADVDDFESDNEPIPQPTTIKRRRSHGDTMRGPPPSKKSTGEKEIKVPELVPKRINISESSSSVFASSELPLSALDASLSAPSVPAAKAASISNISTSLKAADDKSSPPSKPSSLKSPSKSTLQPGKLGNLRPGTPLSERPSLSRHASQPKFSSKPVPMTRVATEDGPGPSIMFTDTPSPPPRRGRLPSAYQPSGSQSFPDHISETSEHSPSSSRVNAPDSRCRSGSAYSTQGIPISFNDLPCRAQHLILNELMKKQSGKTAVMFTTLPSPSQGTCQSQEASAAYLGDLEVLCKGLPPVLLVHSNSMTVTMSL